MAAEISQQIELRPMGLTEREKQVLEQVTTARSPRQIAHQLGLAERTIKSHLSSIERKLGIERTAARDEVRSAGS